MKAIVDCARACLDAFMRGYKRGKLRRAIRAYRDAVAPAPRGRR